MVSHAHHQINKLLLPLVWQNSKVTMNIRVLIPSLPRFIYNFLESFSLGQDHTRLLRNPLIKSHTTRQKQPRSHKNQNSKFSQRKSIY
ncbi:hypothetical protein AHAS_Ahas10G0094800 [Arachis hypogaea]